MRRIILIISTLICANLQAQEEINLDSLGKEARLEYMVAKAKEVAKNFSIGYDWDSLFWSLPIEVDGPIRFAPFNKDPEVLAKEGCPYYSLKLNYSEEEVAKIGYTEPYFRIYFWCDDGQPLDVCIQGPGYTFIYQSYEDWIKEGIKPEEKFKKPVYNPNIIIR